MKKYIRTIVALLLIGSITACNDDFMQQDPIDDMADGTFFTKEADLPLYLDGIYQYYVYGHGKEGTNSTSHDKGFLPVKAGSQIIFGDMFSDNAVYAGGVDAKLGGTYETPTNASKNLDTPWSWTKLRRVNYFLNHYKEVSTSNPDNLKKYAAEAYFFKAWDYYIKLLAVGEVPWLTRELNLTSPELKEPRTPRVQLVDSIMMCLDYAVENAIDNSDAAGRINQDMALFLRAKFCLFEGTFRKYHTELDLTSTASFYLNESAKSAQQIMDKNRYELFYNSAVKNSYWSLFIQKNAPLSDQNKETILARVYNGTKLGHDNPRYWGFNNHTRYCAGAPLSLVEDYLCEDGRPIYIGGSKGAYVVNPLFKGYDKMWEELDNRDPRLRQSICKPGEYATIFDYATGNYGKADVGIIYPMVTYETGGGSPVKMYNSTVTGYRFIKHWMPDKEEWDANAKGKQTAHMFRYGELLLIYAEAKAELGTITNDDLDNTINKLRVRAGYDFVKYPNAKLSLGNIPSDPRLEAIYSEKLDYTVTPIVREVRRERRVEMLMEGMRYEDLMRWKAGNLFTVPLRGMKITDEKLALYDGRVDKLNATTGFKETASPKIQLGNNVIVDSEGFIIPWPKQTTVVNGVLPWNDRRYYYPIPLSELLLNNKLTQNPGWKDISR